MFWRFDLKTDFFGFTKRNNAIYVFITLVAVGCGLIWSVTNVSLDVTYQLSMAYRMIKGDIMFREMWEPHQTSAFLNALFMYPFLKVTGSSTGIVVYLQVIGLLIRAAVAFFVYKILSGELKKPASYGIALILFLVSPKEFSPADFSNMQLWFSVLLFSFLLLYFRSKRVIYVVFAALSMCLLVLSYPSCLIVYFTAVVLMFIFGDEKKIRHILLFTAICAAVGATVLAVWLVNLGDASISECLSGMFSLEPSHTVSAAEKIKRYAKNLCEVVIGLVAIFGVSLLIERTVAVLGRSKGKRKFSFDVFTFSSMCVLAVCFLINILSAVYRVAYSVILVYGILLGFYLRKNMTPTEKRVYICGSAVGLTSFIATLLLSDMDMTVSIPYTVLAVGVALIPISNYVLNSDNRIALKGIKIMGLVFILLWAFRAAYIRTPIMGRAQIMSSFDGISLIRVGPAKGIITGDESCVKEREGYYDFTENVPEGSKVMIVGSLVDSLAYMYGDYEVGAPSVMSDPKYSDGVLEYFRINPDKFPEVVAVPSYQGEIDYDVRKDEWLYSWITESFPTRETKQGTFWTFYFR